MREAIGNAAFFSAYEYVRYYMHRHLKGRENRSYLMDMGIGIVTGGLGGVMVNNQVSLPFSPVLERLFMKSF